MGERRPTLTSTNAGRLFSSVLCCIGITCLVGLSSCATSVEGPSWIRIGETTKEEVIKRYGEPDMVRLSSNGETATYSPAFSPSASPPPVTQAVEPALEGKMTFKPQPVVRGLGARNVADGSQDRPRKEIRIRYDASGIVQDLHEE
jgi:hypothetical protein